VLPADGARAAQFTAFVRAQHASALAHEARAARAEGRAPRAMLPFVSEHDAQALYEQGVLRVGAVLGREHCFRGGAEDVEGAESAAGGAAPPPPPQRPLGLLLSDRRLGDVLVVEAAGRGAAAALREWRNALAQARAEGVEEEEEGPREDGVGSVLVLPPYSVGVGAGAGTGASDADGAAGAADPSLLLVAALVEDFAAWRRGEEAAGRSGDAAGIGAFVRGLVARGAADAEGTARPAGDSAAAAAAAAAAATTVVALSRLVRERAARRRAERAAASGAGEQRVAAATAAADAKAAQ